MFRGSPVTRAAFVIVLASLFANAVAAAPKNLPGGPPWPSGVGQIQTPSGLSSWQSWMGYDADLVVAWSFPASTWADFRTGRADTGAYFQAALKNLPKATTIVHAYPMLPNEASNKGCKNPAVWDQFAAGNFDAHYREMAQNMRQLIENSGRDPSTVILRLGWEMNGDWYPWSICENVAEFKRSWERAVRIIREEMPAMQFDFSASRPYVGYTAGRNYNGGPGVNLAGFLPATDTYDYISRSTHDGQPQTIDDTSWTKSNFNPSSGSKAIGLLELRDTAIARGKKFALSEWSAQMDNCEGAWTASEKPALFLQNVYEFLAANAEHVAWDAYFSVGCTQLYGRQSTDAAKTYKSLWGKASQPVNSPAPEAPELVSVE